MSGSHCSLNAKPYSSSGSATDLYSFQCCRTAYAVRDELDFERRARSSTIGTTSGASENDRIHRGRPAGIQPSAHPLTPRSPNTAQSQSQLSSSETAVEREGQHGNGEGEGEKGKNKEDAGAGNHHGPQSTTDGPIGYNRQDSEQPSHHPSELYTPYPGASETATTFGRGRPQVWGRQPSTDASRWLAFTLPTKYRKRLDEYMASQDQQQQQGSSSLPRESAIATSSSDSSDQEEGNNSNGHGHHGRLHAAVRPGKKRRRTGMSRKHTYDEGEEGQHRTNAHHSSRGAKGPLGQSQSSRRSSHSGIHASRPQVEEESRADPNEGLAMTMNARLTPPSIGDRRFSQSAHHAQTPGWNQPWNPLGSGNNRENNDNNNISRKGGHPHLFRSDTEARLEGLTPIGGNSRRQKAKTRLEKLQHWLVESAFAPLVLRFLNLAFSATILGIAVVSSRIFRLPECVGC